MSTIEPNKQYYTAKELSTLLGISMNTLYKWLKAGKIAGAIQPGGKAWRIPVDSTGMFRLAEGSKHHT